MKPDPIAYTERPPQLPEFAAGMSSTACVWRMPDGGWPIAKKVSHSARERAEIDGVPRHQWPKDGRKVWRGWAHPLTLESGLLTELQRFELTAIMGDWSALSP